MSKYKYIFFDLDGTLCNTKPGIKRCIQYALDKNHLQYNDDLIEKLIGPPFRIGMKRYLNSKEEDIEGYIKDYRGLYGESGWQELEVYDGMYELLDTLKKQGYILCTATSKPMVFTMKILEKYDLLKYFTFVGAAETDMSRETKIAVINYVLVNVKIKDVSEVLMVGDREYDIEGARLAGIETCGCLWGFGDENELKEHKAKYIIKHPLDLLEILS